MPFPKDVLFRGESETLDFKRDQYTYGTDLEKSELLKDILAMANAWRNDMSFILVGIDASISPASVVGASMALMTRICSSSLTAKRIARYSFHTANQR